jgi:carbon-monoxide dehydrogenase medium subunit
MLVEQEVGSGLEVIIAKSREEAIDAFGDGAGVTVVAGGTTVVPLMTYGRLHPERVLMLHHSGLEEVTDGLTMKIGAMVRLSRLVESAPEPLASAARIADLEVRSQATVGGNLCAGGDVQAALIALNGSVRSIGAGGERTEPVEEFVTCSRGRLVLEIDIERADAATYIGQRRLHSHTYTTLAVALARTGDEIRVAVGGAAEHALRCRSVEQALKQNATNVEAGAAVKDDIRPRDDALASAEYKERVLPVLLTRALDQLEETR